MTKLWIACLCVVGCGNSPAQPDAAHHVDAAPDAPSAVCGDHMVNTATGEECDDGNSVANDGCTGCTIDYAMRTITASWTIKTVGGAIQPCPATFDTAAVYSQRLDYRGMPIGQPTIDLFNCVDGTGTTSPIVGGHYAVWIEIANHTNTAQYAKSTTAPVDLRSNNASFAATILTDGGYFGFAWNLTRMSNGAPLTCADVAGIGGVESVTTDVSNSSNSASDIFTCADGQGITGGFTAGTYTVSIDALDQANQAIGTAPLLTNKVITAPNNVTDLGTVTIPITAL